MSEVIVLRERLIERREIKMIAGADQIGVKKSERKRKQRSRPTNTPATEDQNRSFGPFEPAHRASNTQPMHLRKSGGFNTPVSRHIHFYQGVPIKGLRVG